MDEAEPTVTIFVGRTAGGFIKFLKENNLNTIEPARAPSAATFATRSGSGDGSEVRPPERGG